MHGIRYYGPAGTVFDSGRLFYYNAFGAGSREFGGKYFVYDVHGVHFVHL
jgi:hypothetical protein